MRRLDRRALLSATGAALVGGCAAAGPASPPVLQTYPWPLGVQLWSVGAELRRDFEGTLRRLASLGYERVESAGLHGRTPGAFRAAVEAAGLRCDAAHMSMAELLADPNRAVATARDMAVDWLICSSPQPDRPMPAGVEWNRGLIEAMTLEAWRRNAAALTLLAQKARTAGLGFGYHNHPAEFAAYDGRRGYDVLLSETDPALVKMELDIAWAAAGGVDPVALLDSRRDRFVRLHLKGLKALPAPGTLSASFETTVVGQGPVDWRAVIAAARRAGVSGAYVEQEPPHLRPVFDSLAACRAYLRSL